MWEPLFLRDGAVIRIKYHWGPSPQFSISVKPTKQTPSLTQTPHGGQETLGQGEQGTNLDAPNCVCLALQQPLPCDSVELSSLYPC